MKNEKIYGPWIKWHGGECPVPSETMVEPKLRSGFADIGGRANFYGWHHDGGDDDIVEYRTFTEQAVIQQADLEAAEKLLCANGYTVTPPAKPLTFEDVVPLTEAPPEGTVYWVVSALHWEGVFCARFFNAEFDPLLLKRRMAYLEKEHALIAARHIFGLKGGEL